ncbi:MAG: hypothetical protein E3J35_01065 [Methanomassiliicoccales archaeon]|nr:MAG: hypothetical protein E3J35_01065 [Methanomassiliicoccales archaeon]
METSERLVLFRSIPYSSVFNDALRIFKRNNLSVSEYDFDKGLIKAEFSDNMPTEDAQIIAKFWNGKDRILIGLRGSLSFSFTGADKLKEKLKRLQTDLRRLDYAF